MGDDEVDLTELSARAELLAEASGRDAKAVLADLLDDGEMNWSNEKQGVLDRANEQAKKFKALLMTLIPIIALVIGGGGLEMLGIDLMGSDDIDEAERQDEPVITIFWGCMDSTAENYDSMANEDDGSCQYPPPPPPPPEPIYGCTDPAANNYNETATDDDGSCEYDSYQNPDNGTESGNESGNETEPACNLSALFYHSEIIWTEEDNKTLATVRWDADLNCDLTHHIEVDITIKNESGDVVRSIFTGYNTTYQDPDWKTWTWDGAITNETYSFCLSIWLEKDGEWFNTDETKHENQIAKVPESE